LIRTIGALVFPIGLVMIVLSGSDLFTSNVMFMTVAFLHRRIAALDLIQNWVVSFLGNLAGMLFFMAIITGYGGVFEMGAYRTETLNFATLKIVNPQWHQVFLRAIGANWLVCFAVFISISSREIGSKIMAIWWPTATFVALGLDHVIANMYFIPIAIWNSHPQITVGFYIWKSMIPAALGNIAGGGLFVGAMYWYLYLTGEGAVDIDFNLGGLDSAMEAGGPMGRMTSENQPKPNGRYGSEPGESGGKVIKGLDPQANGDASVQLPHSGSHMTSGIGKELNSDMYAKSRGDKMDEEKAL
ncbi:MAG: hypothetical protein Q9222_001257, partial [Ikaeria aurantiellina]